MTTEPAERSTRPLLVAVGCLNVDVIAPVPARPGRDERIMSTGFEREPGGMAANVSCAAAALGAPWPVDAKLVAPVGADESSAWLEKRLEARGVDTSWLDRTSNARATLCLILVEPDGQRAIVSEPSRLSYQRLAECLASNAHHPGPRLVHLDGFHAPGARAHVVEAGRRGWRSSLDLDELSAEHLSEDALLRFAAPFDTLFVNRSRARAVLGERSVEAWADAIAQWSAAIDTTFLLTLGAAGTVVLVPHQAPVRLRPPEIASVDSTGAGDVFAGVYLACSLNGLDSIESARRACIGGALATTGRGALGAVPSAAAIDALIGGADPLLD